MCIEGRAFVYRLYCLDVHRGTCLAALVVGDGPAHGGALPRGTSQGLALEDPCPRQGLACLVEA